MRADLHKTRLSSMSATDLIELAGRIAGAEQASVGSSGCFPTDMHRLGLFFSRKILSQEASVAQRRQFSLHCLSYFKSAPYRDRPLAERSEPSAAEIEERAVELEQRRADRQRKKADIEESFRVKFAERDRLRAVLVEKIAAAQARKEAVAQRRAGIDPAAAARTGATAVLEDVAPVAAQHAAPTEAPAAEGPSSSKTEKASRRRDPDKRKKGRGRRKK
jgi:hypothetical protein